MPVERRWLGLDRTTILPALVVLALAATMALGVPAIDNAVPDGVRARAGDQIGLARGITFVPATGWVITDGILLGQEPRSGGYPSSATVNDGPVSFRVQTAPYSGTAAALLQQIRETDNALFGSQGLHVSEDSYPVRTATGLQGVLSPFRSAASDGVAAAFVIDGTGVKVVMTGSPAANRDLSPEIEDMLNSIRAGPSGGAE